MLTYVWKQRRIGLLCNAMKNHALQERRTARAVPLSPPWQVRSATWQLSISMINAVVPGLPVTKLQSVLLPCFKVKWVSRTTHVHQNALFGITCLSRVANVRLKLLKNMFCYLPGCTWSKQHSRRHWCCWFLSIAKQINLAIKRIILCLSPIEPKESLMPLIALKKYSLSSEWMEHK